MTDIDAIAKHSDTAFHAGTANVVNAANSPALLARLILEPCAKHQGWNPFSCLDILSDITSNRSTTESHTFSVRVLKNKSNMHN